MRQFEADEVREAKEHAKAGGQALHIFNRDGHYDHLTSISVFKRNHPWGHLFDYDRDRLVRTAKRLGVRVIVVDRDGREGQHIDLCGKPLERAMALCTKEE